MDHQSIENNLFRMKVKGIIDNSIIILEKKISIINKELHSLKSEYLEELIKLNELLDNNSFRQSEKIRYLDGTSAKLKLFNQKIIVSTNTTNNYYDPMNLPMTPKTIKKDTKHINLPGMYKKGDRSVTKGKIINASLNMNGKFKYDSYNKNISFKNSHSEIRKEKQKQNNDVIKPKLKNIMLRNDSMNSKDSPLINNTKDINIANLSRDSGTRSVSKESSNTEIITKHKKLTLDSQSNNTLIAIDGNRKFSILDIPSSNQHKDNSKIITAYTPFLDSNKYNKAFYVLANSRIIPINQRITFSYINKFVKDNCRSEHIIEDGLKTIRERMTYIENKEILVGFFKPTKTALHAINFLSEDDIEELKTCTDQQIINIFRILHIIYTCKDDESENIISKILSNHKRLNVFMHQIIHKLNYFLTKDQIRKIINIISENEDITKPNHLYTKSKSGSNFAYCIKEIYEYVCKLANIDLRSLYEYRKLVDDKILYDKFKK